MILKWFFFLHIFKMNEVEVKYYLYTFKTDYSSGDWSRSHSELNNKNLVPKPDFSIEALLVRLKSVFLRHFTSCPSFCFWALCVSVCLDRRCWSFQVPWGVAGSSWSHALREEFGFAAGCSRRHRETQILCSQVHQVRSVLLLKEFLVITVAFSLLRTQNLGVILISVKKNKSERI